MFKAISCKESVSKEKSMGEMSPCEIARITDKEIIVMRTASTTHCEIMELFPNPGRDCCWTGGSSLKVIPLKKGEKIILEVIGRQTDE
jgi:hypothetical protein